MNPVGCFDIPVVWHADKVTYVRALRWMLSGTAGHWSSVGRYERVGYMKAYNKFYLVKIADKMSRELNF